MTKIDFAPVLDSLKTWITTATTQDTYNILGIIGFILSALIWIYTYRKNRVLLDVEIKDYTKVFGRVVQLYLYIQNNSGSPLTISGISIVHNEKKYPCVLLPRKIRGTGEDLIKTPMFPINLSPHEGILLPFEFSNCQDIELALDKTVALEIYTNRKMIEKSLILGRPDHLLHE